MKKNKIILVGLSLLLLVSCEKPLDPIIKSDITESNFFKTEADLDAATVANYNRFHQFYSGSYSVADYTYQTISNSACGQFVGNPGYGQTVYTRSYNLGWQAGDDDAGNGYLFWVCNKHVEAVTQASKSIINIKKASVSEAIKNKYIGQLLALRAWNSFIIYDLFDPIPLINTDEKANAFINNPNDEAFFEPPTEQQRVNDIETDLLAAIDMLDVSAPQGRMTKGIARTMLLKLYMQEKQWAKAEAIARVIKTMNYSAQSTYKAVFAYSNQNNAEIIWGIPGSNAPWPSLGAINNNLWRIHVLPYEYSRNGRAEGGYSYFRMPWSQYDRFAANDKRRQIIDTSFTSFSSGVLVSGRTNPEFSWGALPLKYWEEDLASKTAGDNINYVVFRLADVDMLLAEAINEQVGPTAEAINLVDFYHKRAGLTSIIATPFTKTSFRTLIFNERFFELWGEATGRLDLIRQGTFLSAATARGVNAQTKHLKLPTASNLILQSKGKIKQRPGY